MFQTKMTNADLIIIRIRNEQFKPLMTISNVRLTTPLLFGNSNVLKFKLYACVYSITNQSDVKYKRVCRYQTKEKPMTYHRLYFNQIC